MSWLNRNSGALQALAALFMAATALVALIGVKFQVDASYRVQREQSAKEIYRELLNISIANPDYAAPDYCALRQSPRFSAYESYVDYVLYTAEQVIEMDASWALTMEQHMQAHEDYICSRQETGEQSPAVQRLLQEFEAKYCKARPAC